MFRSTFFSYTEAEGDSNKKNRGVKRRYYSVPFPSFARVEALDITVAPVLPPPAGSDAGGQQQQQQQQQQHASPVSNQTGELAAAAGSNTTRNASDFNYLRENSRNFGDMQDRFGGLNVRDAASRPSDPSGRPAAASAASELGGESWEPSRTVYNENTRPTGRTDNPAAAAPLLASTQGFGSHIGPEVDDSVQDQHLTAEGSLGTASVLTRRQSASGANRVDDGRRSDIMWRRTLRIGSNLDVKDTVDKWCEASVIDLDGEAGMVRVTYTFWTPKARRESETERSIEILGKRSTVACNTREATDWFWQTKKALPIIACSLRVQKKSERI